MNAKVRESMREELLEELKSKGIERGGLVFDFAVDLDLPYVDWTNRRLERVIGVLREAIERGLGRVVGDARTHFDTRESNYFNP